MFRALYWFFTLCWLRHHYRTLFREEGVYWCWSAGPYDCQCRCGARWENTTFGAANLAQSQAKDPRVTEMSVIMAMWHAKDAERAEAISISR